MNLQQLRLIRKEFSDSNSDITKWPANDKYRYINMPEKISMMS
jgi:hypothetical protein